MLPNLKKSADGSLALYIRRDSPGSDKVSAARAGRTDHCNASVLANDRAACRRAKEDWQPPGVQRSGQ